MKIGNRKIGLFKIVFDSRHYRALINIFLFCREPFKFLAVYFLGLKNIKYPVVIRFKTPIGPVAAKLYSYYDFLTVNEIFFRLDYLADKKPKTVIDIGANIGISALYFLSRNQECKCYLYEPVEENVIKLKDNLKDFNGRYELKVEAVYNQSGEIKFGTEEFGRCGGINRVSGKYITVKCVNINSVLAEVLSQADYIDLLKIDIEGDEVAVVKAIDSKFFKKIGVIYFEIDYSVNLPEDFKIFPDFFRGSRYGNTYIMKAL